MDWKLIPMWYWNTLSAMSLLVALIMLLNVMLFTIIANIVCGYFIIKCAYRVRDELSGLKIQTRIWKDKKHRIGRIL